MNQLNERLANLSPAKRQLMEQVLQGRKQVAEPIAICGMGCRFPGASSAKDYWQLLLRKQDAIQEIPPSRWDVDAFYDPTGEIPGKISTRWGTFLENVDQFDPLFFGLSPREAEKIDPQQRLLLEVAWEALEDGGIAPEELGGTKTGVFIGISGVDYSRIPSQLADHYQQISVHSGTGNALSIAANRLSYLLDLRGPSLIVDTACSSSLVALHLAVRSLRSRESDSALVGGVNLILTPETTVAFSRARMLSPTGQCLPFDATANGYVRGEGAGVVVLKRLADAVATGDRVLAVIRSSAINQDGRTAGITAPNSLSQQVVLRTALAEAGLSTDQISYLEAHGTGTPLGDPIEMEALGALFGRQSADDPPCHVGSVKANIGHTETAAGIASLLKVVLMLQHGQIPGQAHLEQLNPLFSLQDTRLKISRESISWSTEGSRLAGISAFGFGGTNAHVIVEGAPSVPLDQDRTERPCHLLTLSGKTDAAVRQSAERYGQFLDTHPGISLAELCHTASVGRTHFQHRLAIGVENLDQLRKGLDNIGRRKSSSSARQGVVAATGRPKIAFLFAGQGSQYVGMGRELFQSPGPFRETLIQCDQILADLLDESLLALLHYNRLEGDRLEGDRQEADRLEGALNETIYTQPALFALEVALARQWQSWGVEPEMLLGHSIGEYAAACFAGVFTLEEGLRLVAHRGRFMQQLPIDGLMAVVFAPPETVHETIAPYVEQVSVAANNGPENTVISGSAPQVRRLCEIFTQAGFRTQLLTVSHAFHSPQMDPMLERFEQLAEEIDYQAPSIPIVSNLTGRVMADERLDARYWRDHIRSTVLFAEGAHRLAAYQPDAVVEMGPSATLLGMARQVASELPAAWLPSLRKGQSDWRTLLASLAELYVRGVQVDWRGFDRPWSRRRVHLPTYPFQRRSLWYDLSQKNAQQSPGLGHDGPVHPLLGWQVPTALAQTIYENRLRPSWPSYLADHQVQGSVIVPAAAYLEQSLAAAQQQFGPGPHVLENVAVQQAMVLTEENPRAVQLTLAPEADGQCGLEIFSRQAETPRPDDGWILHACGSCRPLRGNEKFQRPERMPLDEIRARLSGKESTVEGKARAETKSRESFYREMAQHGLVYGPTFQVLGALARDEAETLARVDLPEQVLKQQAEYHLHPALLDGCFQAMAGIVPRSSDGGDRPDTYVPTFIRRLRLVGQPAGPLWIHAIRTSASAYPSPETVVGPSPETAEGPSPETVEGDVWLLDDLGDVIAELEGVRVQRLGRAGDGQSLTGYRDWSYRLCWQERGWQERGWQEGPLTGPTGEAPNSESEATHAEPALRLIFADRQGIGAALAALPDDHAAQYVLVTPGNKYRHETRQEASTVDCYQIDPCSADDYRRLFDQLRERFGRQTCEVIHLWSCDLVMPNPQDRTPVGTPPHDTVSNHAMPTESGLATMDDVLKLSDQIGCGSLLPLIQQLARTDFVKRVSLTLVTRGAQALPDPRLDSRQGSDNPSEHENKVELALAQTPLWGLGRVAAMELPELQVRLIDLDPTAEPEADARCLARELDNPAAENQVAYRSATRYVARLQRDPENLSIPEEQVGSTSPPAGPFRLRLTTPGKFSALRYVPLTRKRPDPDQVELEVGSTGLNFSDVLKAMGLYPGIQDEMVPLGIECAGVVTAVGDRTGRFQVGDRVMGVAPYSFASHVVTAPYTLVAIPEQLSDDQACTIPIPFLTAHYALCHLAHLQPGEKVLIHAGAGGVGQAAIQIAQKIGAEIFTTAGSDEKREFLRGQGIEHVLNSRTLDFAEEILAATDRRGIDCVLNSLPGEAIAKSLSVLTAYGRFLEIGKIDIYQNRMLGLLPFQDNLSYFAIDLDRLLRQRRQTIEQMFAQLMPFFERGDYRPLPLTRFAADETVDAFRYMAQRKNIGKIVVSLQDRAHEPHRSDLPERSIRTDATYLITGGLGALGLRVAHWLVGQGATHLVLLSRRNPSAAVRQELESLDAQVAVVQGDVTRSDSLAAALKQIPNSFPPLRGTFHAAGVLADRLLLAMDHDGLARAMAPKVQGAWNLHNALAAEPLDFFVLFSSVASLLGAPGQANYAAGNAFLDGLAQFRRQQGLVASSIQWGPWADAGMATTGGVEQQVMARGMQPMAPDRALAALGVIVANKPPHAIVMDVRWDDLLDQFSGAKFSGARPALLENFARQETEPAGVGEANERDEEFCQRLGQAGSDEKIQLLQTYIAETVASIMEVDLENLAADQPLSALGLDSLMGMELKATLEGQLGLNLPMASLLDSPSVAKLAEFAGQAWAGEAGISPESPGQENQTIPHPKTGPTGLPLSSSAASYSPLVALAPEGGHAPLFCIHPVGGDVRCYSELAKALPRDWPVWALRPRGLDSLSGPHRSMEELSKDYLRAIRQIQPAGPLNLLGWSTGGIFAQAIADRLQTHENEDSALVFLDTPTPEIFQNVDLSDDARFLYELVNFSNWFGGTDMRVSYKQLRRQDLEASLQDVLQTAMEQGVLPKDTPVEHLRRIIEVSRENVRLLMGYEPKSLECPVQLIRPRETGVLAEAASQSLEHDLGWGRILGERLQLQEVPGDHFSMLLGENTRHVAEALIDCLG